MNKNAKIAAVIIVVLVAVGGIALVSRKDKTASNTTTSTTSENSAAANTSTDTASAEAVSIKGFAFGPASVTVKVGSTVTWTNNDDVHHTVTADTASSDAPDSQEIGKGETYSFTFVRAGTYTYHCAPHPYMHGTVVVTE